MYDCIVYVVSIYRGDHCLPIIVMLHFKHLLCSISHNIISASGMSGSADKMARELHLLLHHNQLRVYPDMRFSGCYTER